MLRDEWVARNNGIVEHARLEQIWSRDEDGVSYEPGFYPAFRALMRKFDLSFEIEELLPGIHSKRSLIPQLLPYQPPPEQAAWPEAAGNGETELEMVYELGFVPAGIMSWFIVRTHHYTKNLHWRDGTILEYEGHRAKIELNKPLQTVSLIVQGPSPHNFFTILMKTLDLILDRFPGLAVKRHVPCICYRYRRQGATSCGRTYLYEDLVRFLKADIDTVMCPETLYKNVRVAEMLFGIHPSTINSVLAEIRTLREGQDQLKELVGRNFTRMWNFEMRRLEAECPNTFFLTPEKSQAFNPKNLAINEFRLRLICQHPPSPHATEGEGYKVRQSKEWWATVSPWLAQLTKFLKHAIPLGLAIGGVYDEKAMEDMKAGTNLLERIVDQLPAEIINPEDESKIRLAGRQGADLQALEGAALRALHKYLVDEDPSQTWGGLSRVVTLDGNILWVCDSHKKEYDR